MSRIHHIRRLTRVLAGLAGALAGFAAAPAALAGERPPPGPLSRFEPGPVQLAQPGNHTAVSPHLHAALTGGMPGWQITLIAIGAALAAAALAVLLDRAVTSR